ncbi:MAG: hypothetical protein Q8L40_11330, partial [Burkholderiales bacterium]|nr:hypothetical protein [Burkholderiales bacterium]
NIAGFHMMKPDLVIDAAARITLNCRADHPSRGGWNGINMRWWLFIGWFTGFFNSTILEIPA